MKKSITLITALLFTYIAVSQQVLDTLAAWTFPTGELTDTMADISNSFNQDKYIYTDGASAIEMKNGATTKAAQATGWEDGMGTKSWQLEVNTTGLSEIMVSSKLSGGGNEPGPRDYSLEYRLGSTGIWTNVSGGEISVANDWTTGVLESIILPTECNSQTSVYLRWVMTSNLDVNGVDVLSTGKAKIDDIYIVGNTGAGIYDSFTGVQTNIYPNPVAGYLNIETNRVISSVQIYSIVGNLITKKLSNNKSITINTDNMEKGQYLVKIQYKDNSSETRRILVN